MTIDSPRAAREAVYEQLKDYRGCQVSKGDKPLKRPASVSVGTDGMDPVIFRVAVRLYITIDEARLGNAYDLLDDHMAALDLLLAGSPFGPSNWDVTGDDNPPLLIATCVLELGREDFG